MLTQIMGYCKHVVPMNTLSVGYNDNYKGNYNNKYIILYSNAQ